ncbi:MAG: site-specific integrase [Planctomycetota bacterium]|nr:site-specific integrase [Planctomycetota bacterium]
MNEQTDNPTPGDDREIVPATGAGSLHVGADGLTTADGATTHPAVAYLAGLAKRSRRTMKGALDAIASMGSGGTADALTFPWHELRFEHTTAIRTGLAERYPNPSTVNLHLAALRGVLRACWRLGLMDGETYQRAADVPSVKGSTLPKGRALGAGEIRALFQACASDPSPAGRRDAALLAVMYGTGLRRAEVAGLQAGDIDHQTGAIVVRGKGNKERTAYLANGAGAAVADWIMARGDEPGPLFLRIRKDGQIGAEGLTAQAIYNALRKRAEQAGVARFSPHDLRRTFVGDMLDAGADVSLVAKLAGHAQVTTTARYDRRPERAKQKAAGMLFVPFVRSDPESGDRNGP